MSEVYDDSVSRPLGPEALPEPDPRVRFGFGRPPEPVTEPVTEPGRHPAGQAEGKGGQFR